MKSNRSINQGENEVSEALLLGEMVMDHLAKLMISRISVLRVCIVNLQTAKMFLKSERILLIMDSQEK